MPRYSMGTCVRVALMLPFSPSRCPSYRPGVMHEIKKNQHNLVTWMNDHPEEAKGINPYFFVIMDDCISQVCLVAAMIVRA